MRANRLSWWVMKSGCLNSAGSVLMWSRSASVTRRYSSENAALCSQPAISWSLRLVISLMTSCRHNGRPAVHASGELGSNPVRFGESSSAGSNDVVVGGMSSAVAAAGAVASTPPREARTPARRPPAELTMTHGYLFARGPRHPLIAEWSVPHR